MATQGNGPRAGTALAEPTNDGAFTVETATPYIAEVTIQGTAAMLFHRWSCEDVEAKSKAAKNSKAKKTDNVEAYLDMRRVTVQRNGVTRIRPAFLAGWEATVQLQVLTPEYISPDLLLAVIADAGRLVGVADHRPTYGRFQVTRYEVT